MKKSVIIFLLFFSNGFLYSQVAVNNDGTSANSSAMFEVKSTNAGVLISRMTATQRDAINSPVEGLMVYVTSDSSFYFYEGSNWSKIGIGSSGWECRNNKIFTDTLHSVSIGDSSGSGVFQVITDEATGIFTADVCFGGTASASESYAGKSASNAFDNSNSTYWSNDNNLPAWVQYDFGDGNGKVIACYRVYFESANYDASPNDWTFQASNDASSWITLDSQTNQGWSSNIWNTYIFTNTNRYRYYRINITDNKGSTDDYVSINELVMKEMTYSKHNTFVVSSDNKVGIGTGSPGATLHVAGTMQFEDGNEAAGNILVSDASGNASWADGATVNGGGWTVSGNHIYTSSDSVGIGTSYLNASLTVNGRISITGNGSSVFVGYGAGINDDLSTNGNVFVGNDAGHSNTIGDENSAIGKSALWHNTTGDANSAYGAQSLYQNTTGIYNSAFGRYALRSNTTGDYNCGMGTNALYTNTSGQYNVAIGNYSLNYNDDGSFNTAIGSSSLYFNQNGDSNCAFGYRSLCRTTSSSNVAFGVSAAYMNTSGSHNTAIGTKTLYSLTTANNNTAVGYHASYSNITGYSNTGVGFQALDHVTTGYKLTAIGHDAGPISSYSNINNSSAIGNNSRITASNQIRIGNTNVTSIGGYTTWSNVSDGRFKQNIREEVHGLDFILKLRPVVYNLNVEKLNLALGIDETTDDIDRKSIQEKSAIEQTGFIAQEVEEAAKELGYDFSGVDAPKNENDHYGLRYAEFVVPLVKAVQEQQEIIELLKIQNEELTKRIELLEKSQ